MAVEAWMLYRHVGTLLRWVMGMASPARVVWMGWRKSSWEHTGE